MIRVQVRRRPGAQSRFALDPSPGYGDSGELRITGWVVHPEFRVREVRFGRGDQVLARAHPDIHRPGAEAAHSGFPGAKTAGFELCLPSPRTGEYWLGIEADGEMEERLAVVDLIEGRQSKLLFMHIAKAAGSTVNAFFAQQFPRGEALVHIESEARWRNDPASLQAYRYLSGHVGYHALRRRLDLEEFHLVTVVREPLAQLASHLAWVRRLSEPGEEARFKRHPDYVRRFSLKLADCDFTSAGAIKSLIASLNDQERRLVDNCQVRYFAPVNHAWAGPEDLAAARRAAMRFGRIGLAEDLDAFLSGVASDLGWPPPGAIRRENVTRDFYGLERAGPRIRRALRPLLRFDSKLYDFIRLRQNR